MNEEALTVYFSWAKPTEESLRTIDDLSSHEQAKIAASMYVAMSDLPAKTGWLQKTITVRFGALLAVNAIIPVLSCLFFRWSWYFPARKASVSH
jgi:hypothetical protein